MSRRTSKFRFFSLEIPYLLSCSLDSYRIVFFKDGCTLVHGTNEPAKEFMTGLLDKILMS
ncbi:hypothetical protein D1970_19280 [Mesobacillus zeae]|uniref:Uncharacterized protein n=1 Tax=Mesobacillus zeae TaxID=1917180 RepID=A0A398B3E8_9BACI|nr:hypothetical protein D1970_19280 [Mesobacillus zeae]